MRTVRPRTGKPAPLALHAERRSVARDRSARSAGARGRSLLLARLVAVLALLGAALLPRPAHAAGTVTIADRSPKEDGGRWKLKMTINYGSTPHLAHIPMLFSFTPKVLYERALTDQSPERPILNRIPLQGQPSINESMDVGFSDGSGKIFSTTKFDFVLRRDRGFEAGEYELKITRTDDGAQMGSIQKITLQGENAVIDRRAIVFSGEKKKKDDKAEKGDGDKANDAAAAEGEAKPADASPAEPPAEAPPADEAPPPVPPKQGGCGCRLAPDDAAPLAPHLAALALGALALRRRGQGPRRPAARRRAHESDRRR